MNPLEAAAASLIAASDQDAARVTELASIAKDDDCPAWLRGQILDTIARDYVRLLGLVNEAGQHNLRIAGELERLGEALEGLG